VKQHGARKQFVSITATGCLQLGQTKRLLTMSAI
jgi:hypothetical protein